ncbi:hypothetical protein H5410_030306 [Solanum commersonii]|uniref:Uncharacterized protein n=1 Tax=Solanum commersonii TaxID=4109 RepID=A0A9J5YH25_SOLCO|nr:hypothetical protein H5410_030306 [Solanum commersonii]
MGRVRLSIKRVESNSYFIGDLLFGKFPKLLTSRMAMLRSNNFDEIIAKFAQLTPQERAKRKLESLQVSLIFITTMCFPLSMVCCYFLIHLKVITMLMVTLQTLRKTFKKLDIDIGVPEFLDASRKREEREKKREEEIAAIKEVENKSDESDQEGDENDKSDKESEGDEE